MTNEKSKTPASDALDLDIAEDMETVESVRSEIRLGGDKDYHLHKEYEPTVLDRRALYEQAKRLADAMEEHNKIIGMIAVKLGELNGTLQVSLPILLQALERISVDYSSIESSLEAVANRK